MAKEKIIALIAFLCFSAGLFAQINTATIVGTIKDKSGSVIPRAEVTATNMATDETTKVFSNDRGDYTITPLKIGKYRLTVELPGFKRLDRGGIILETIQVARVDFLLDVGDISETVSVSGGSPLIETETSAMGQVIDNREIVDMPLNGRNFVDLALLVPGANDETPGSNAQGLGNAETLRGNTALSVNGFRATNNNYLLDGVDNNESLVNTIAHYPPLDAIQEFKVQTSVASAEFGRSGGGVVNVNLKSGTNQLHGNIFEFLRNEAFDARSFFLNARRQPDGSPLPKPPFRQNQFGFTLGGPVIKDKTFFFVDYQGMLQNVPFNKKTTVPTERARQGDFGEYSQQIYDPATFDPTTRERQPFADNRILRERFDPAGFKLLQQYPLPNFCTSTTRGCATFDNYLATWQRRRTFNNFDVKIDHRFAGADTLFSRFSFGQAEVFQEAVLKTLPSGFGNGTNHNDSRQFALGYSHIFNPRIINEFRFNFSRIYISFQPGFYGRNLASEWAIPNINRDLVTSGAPLVSVSGIETIGDGGPYITPQNTFQYLDFLTYIRGSHNLKFGVDLRRRQVNILRGDNIKGNFWFDGYYTRRKSSIPGGLGIADLLLGITRTGRIGDFPGSIGTRSTEFATFIQDDWKVSKELTLNLGLRYELNTPPVEVYNRQSNFDPGTGQVLVAGRNGVSPTLVNTFYKGFAPRIGLAYRLTEDNKMVLHAGYGISYMMDRGGVSRQLFNNFPQIVNSVYEGDPDNNVPALIFSQGFVQERAPSDPAHPYGTVRFTNPNNPASYSQQWNVSIQREFRGEYLFEMAYVGTKGTHLLSATDINRPIPAPRVIDPSVVCPLRIPPDTRRPFYALNPCLASIPTIDNYGSSNYNSLQIKARKRFAKGLYYLAAYTWSHATADSIGAFGGHSNSLEPQDVTNLAAERGNASFDIRHRGTFSWGYDLPVGKGRLIGKDLSGLPEIILGGWRVGNIATIQSGNHFTVNLDGDVARTSSAQRPNRIGTGELPSSERSVDRYFNIFDFARPNDYTYGNSGRNILTGPGLVNFDFSLFKEFRINETRYIQFRTEIFNAFNHPAFGIPNNSIKFKSVRREDGTDYFIVDPDQNAGKIGSTRRAGSNLHDARQFQLALKIYF
ncbi:MAG: TonB-dependent receptor [Acidobacteria bacterium]|nr:TonB-dependent receptor [Acidobacteriota bacterium]MBI3654959.1 TonB-dependent receptor [Acidobacteriota bacterium]